MTCNAQGVELYCGTRHSFETKHRVTSVLAWQLSRSSRKSASPYIGWHRKNKTNRKEKRQWKTNCDQITWDSRGSSTSIHLRTKSNSSVPPENNALEEAVNELELLIPEVEFEVSKPLETPGVLVLVKPDTAVPTGSPAARDDVAGISISAFSVVRPDGTRIGEVTSRLEGFAKYARGVCLAKLSSESVWNCSPVL